MVQVTVPPSAYDEGQDLEKSMGFDTVIERPGHFYGCLLRVSVFTVKGKRRGEVVLFPGVDREGTKDLNWNGL